MSRSLPRPIAGALHGDSDEDEHVDEEAPLRGGGGGGGRGVGGARRRSGGVVSGASPAAAAAAAAGAGWLTWQPGSTPSRSGFFSAAVAGGGGAVAGSSHDGGGGHLSRSFAHGGSFVAGHSVFARSAAQSLRSSVGRSPHEPAVNLTREASGGGGGGPFLGLEPGLGLTAPLLDQHQHHPRHHERSPTTAAAAGGEVRFLRRQSSEGVPSALLPPPLGDASAAAAADAAEAGGVAKAAGAPHAAAAAAAAGGAPHGGEQQQQQQQQQLDGAATREAMAEAAKAARLQQDVIYGVVNAVVGLPTMISFAAIVYQAAVYKPLLGQLARMSFFSAAVHQLIFTLCSSLPFAVGQPQDVGLIFLSAMATSVAEIGADKGASDAEIVGTALLTLTTATFLVGLLTYLVAKLRLATLVQYVPLPVVGGYLGFVGYFCLAAGISLGCSVEINSFGTWGRLFAQDALIKFVPTIAAALALWVCMTRAESPWALPLTLAAVPASFHLYLLLSGTTLAQAQDAGWVLKPEGKSTQQFWELYELFNITDWRLDGVDLGALVRQIPKMLGLFFVVTFGSCLDVAAIQADMPFPIDFNGELATVGLSNIVVGLSGSGYTGSYIFSQTIFSMRAGVSSAWHGAVIFGLEAAVFLLPFSVVQYLPNFFFGALLTVFGIEIAGDWLVRSRAKVSQAEYYLLLATFVAIMQLELEAGVAAGILMCTLYFAVTYARANLAAVTVLPTRSAAVRSYQESHVLEALSGRLATVALSGFMFFGSSVLMSGRVVQLAEAMIGGPSSDGDGDGGSLRASGLATPERGGAAAKDHARSALSAAAAALQPPPAQPPLSSRPSSRRTSREFNGGGPTGAAAGAGALADLRLASLAVVGSPQAADGGAGLGLDLQRLELLARAAPATIILDFRRVLGIDATAAQTMGSLAMVLRRMGVALVLTRVTDASVRRLLAAHGIIAPRRAAVPRKPPRDDDDEDEEDEDDDDDGGARARPLLQDGNNNGDDSNNNDDEDDGYCRVFETLNEGATYAEDRLLAVARQSGLLLLGEHQGLTLEQFFDMHIGQQAPGLMPPGFDAKRVAAAVRRLGRERRLPPRQRLFSFGEAPESFFLVLQGVVEIRVKTLLGAAPSLRAAPARLDPLEIERTFSSGQGAVVGITDFVLRRLRSFRAVAAPDKECVLWEVKREALAAMVAEAPEVATALQAVLLRDACLSELYSYEVLERSARA